MKRLLTALTVIGATASMANAQLVINELMQSNIDCLYADNEFPDSWVELYNTGNEPVSLTGYSLSDNEEGLDAYVIEENVEIPVGGFMVIYCDKVGEGLHADFRLDSGKGDVYLFAPDGSLADGVTFKKMPAPNISYGRTKNGGDKWGYMMEATPGSGNNANVAKDLSPQPVFEGLSPGLVAAPGAIRISLPEEGPEGMQLCVTTDGREPGAQDVVEGNEINIEVDKTMVVRAKVISPNTLTIPSTAHSYIFHPEETNLTVVSITTDPSYLYDEEMGIITGSQGDVLNYTQDWRRPLNIEIFDSENGHSESVNQLCEFRVHGGYTRQQPQKSFAVYANKRFGTKRFNSEHFWPDKPEVTEVKSFVLRNGGNDFWFSHMRDQLAQTIAGRNVQSQLDWMAYRPVICYINGEYAGIYDLRERSNEDFIEANYGTEDFDMIENWYEVKNGSNEEFTNFVEFFQKEDLSLEDLYTQADVDAFVDMLIINAYVGNDDFIGNNFICWRLWEGDTRWRFLLKDLDRNALNHVSPETNYFEFIRDYADGHDPSQWGRDLATLFRLFVEKDGFKELYAERFAVALGDYLHIANTHSVVDEMFAEVEPEVRRHSELYFPLHDTHYDDVMNEAVNIKEWYGKRNKNVYRHISEFFGFGEPVDLVIEREDRNVEFCGRTLTQPSFDGMWFEGRNIQLSTDFENPVWFVRSIVREEDTWRENHDYFYDQEMDFTVPADCKNVVILLADAAGVGNIEASEINCQDVYDLTGRYVGKSIDNVAPGIYIRGGKKIMVK